VASHFHTPVVALQGGRRRDVKALWTLNRYLTSGQARPSLRCLPKTHWAISVQRGLGGSLRLRRPHDVPARNAFTPAPHGWMLTHFTCALAGSTERASRSRRSFGTYRRIADLLARPFVRYFHIMQEPERSGFDNRDAKILSLGLSLEVGTGVPRQPEATAAAEVRTITKEIFLCPDRDNDGVPDSVDHCPDVAGPPDNWGCPLPKARRQTRQTRAEGEIYFAWDQAVLQDVSFPVLDEVVQALKDNKGFRVQVEGHTSSEGSDDHNQTLSRDGRRRCSTISLRTALARSACSQPASPPPFQSTATPPSLAVRTTAASSSSSISPSSMTGVSNMNTLKVAPSICCYSCCLRVDSGW